MTRHQFDLVSSVDHFSEWRHRGNGLSLLTFPTPVAPVVSLGVVYSVGSRNEGTGSTGATHILEHLMFKGSERFNRDRGTEVARVLQRVGADFNATTWLDRTSYFETLAVEHLDLAVALEADRMRGALVRDEDLASERTVVLNELERGENSPFELLMKDSFAHAFLEHPYHHPTIGWRSDVETISGEVLRRFYDTFYHPDNATVIVVGDLDQGAMLEAVERGFGALPPAPAPVPAVHSRETEQRGERRFAIHRAAEIGHMVLTWHVPEGLHPDLAPLSVAAQVLAEGVTSRLYQQLVESNLCLGVHAQALELHDPGAFQVYVTLAPGVAHAEVEGIVLDEVARLHREVPSAEEVARARIQVRTDLAFNRESPTQIVAALTEAVAMGDWRRFLNELELVSAVTPEDLSRVASTYLTRTKLTAGWFVPESPTAGGSEALPRGPRPCHLHEAFAERVTLHPLPGGARLAVLPNPHAPTVTVAGTMRAGVACARDGRFTVPSVTAAMLDRGTRSHSRMEIATELEDHGLQLAVEASATAPATIAFSAQGLAESLPRLAALLVEVLREPSFPAEELERVREQLHGSLARERLETFPRAFAALTRRLFPAGHPHHRRSVEAREAELDALTCDHLETFHHEAYGTASLVMAVVGDVAPDAVADLLARPLEGWQGGLDELPEWPVGLDAEPGEELIHIPDRPNLDVFLGHAGRLLLVDPDYPAAVLANACLGYSTLTSRLGRALRDEAGLTYGIHSRHFGTLHLPGPWATFLTVSADNLERAVAMCRAVIADYVEQGPSKEELADERTSLAGAYRVGLATNPGVARELVTNLSAGLGVECLDTYSTELLHTNRDQVVAAIRRHFHPERLVLTAAGTLEQGRAL